MLREEHFHGYLGTCWLVCPSLGRLASHFYLAPLEEPFAVWAVLASFLVVLVLNLSVRTPQKARVAEGAFLASPQ